MIDDAEFHRMANSADVEERKIAIEQLADNFASFSDKDAACSNLIQLMQDDDNDVRRNAARAIVSIFLHIPDKDKAWSALHRLTQAGNESVQGRAAWVIVSAFSHIPDKDTAWSDLIQLAQDGNDTVHLIALGNMFGSVFSHIPDKDKAWSDLHRLTQNENNFVRWWAADVLRSVFSYIPDKDAAWSTLHRLTQDGDSDVRKRATDALGSAFSHVPDKDAAWSDLHRLTQDEDICVQWCAAGALGSAFSHIPDKDIAWSTLHRLTQNEDKNVRMYAYHSLGSASVYKATETEDEEKFREELKKSIDYFEKSSQEVEYKFHNPTSFCLPFYRSYYAIISEKQEAEAEAAKYLDEAKDAVGRSESKEALLKAVENLANALKEAQKPDFHETKEHLRACRQYCDHTAELADSARGKSPVAAAAIMRGIPIVGVKLKRVVAEIQEKAKEACRKSQGTSTEEIACTVNQEFQKRYISNQDDLTRNIENIIFILKSKIPQIPQNKHIHEEIEKLREECDMAKHCAMVPLIIALIPTVSVHTGDVINAEVTASGESQVVVKGNENKNASDNAPVSKKSLLERINTPVTFGGFIGFVIGGIGSYLYPTQPISIIGIVSVSVAVLAAIIFSIFNKE